MRGDCKVLRRLVNDLYIRHRRRIIAAGFACKLSSERTLLTVFADDSLESQNKYPRHTEVAGQSVSYKPVASPFGLLSFDSGDQSGGNRN